MRFSDWSSDVCSSDLPAAVVGGVLDARRQAGAAMIALQLAAFGQAVDVAADGLRGDREQLHQFVDRGIAALGDDLPDAAASPGRLELGSTSCRERRGQYV